MRSVHRTGYILIVLSLLIVQVAQAQTVRPRATNYWMPTDVQPVGGGEAAKSTKYILDDTVGEANIGPSRSDTYDLNAGYRQTVAPAYIAMNCDDTADLGAINVSGVAEGSATCTVTTDADAGYALTWRAGTNNSNGLVGHWKMDETTGTTAYDSSGYGNDGSHANTPTIVSTVPSAYFSTRALDLNGSSQRVEIANEENFDFERTDPFSISMWFKADSLTPTVQTLFSKMGGSPYTGYSLDLYDGTNSDALSFFLINNYSGSDQLWIRSANQNLLSTDTWYHVSVTYDGSNDASGLRMYLNGSRIAHTVSTNNLTGTIQNDTVPKIGSRGDNSGHFNGQVDEVRVYNREITAAEIRALASKAPPGALTLSGSQTTHIAPAFMPFTGGLVGHWKMDEPVAGTVADSSGYGNDGTPGGTGGANNKPVVSADVPTTNIVTTRSLDFDGTDDEVSASLDSAPGNSYTYTLWLRADTTTSGEFAFSLGGNGDQNLRFTTGNKLNAMSYNDSATLQTKTGDASIQTGAWYHVTVVRDAAASELRLYLNGQLDGAAASVSGNARYNSNNVAIGRRLNTGSTYFEGQIDDVRIYNRALSAEEIAALYGTPQTWSVSNTDARWGARLSSASDDTDAKWGTDNSSEKWINVGEGTYPLVTRSSRTDADGSDEIIEFRAEIGATAIQAPGLYTAPVVFTASAL